MKEFSQQTEGHYTERSEFRKARERAMIFLSYADYTKKSMIEKLTDCGFDDEAVEYAVSYLIDRKYIDEKKYLKSICTYFAEKKKYGRNKIIASLHTRGFSSEILSENLYEILSEFDFLQICLYHIEKTKNLDLSDKKSRDKLIASLVRKGFTLSEIKEAIQLCKEQNEE